MTLPSTPRLHVAGLLPLPEQVPRARERQRIALDVKVILTLDVKFILTPPYINMVLVTLHIAYTGWRQNDFNIYA
jgi:hypothetical protein